MFTQFSEISARFIQVDKSKGVKRLLFSPQYIEHKISIFNEIFNRMKEQKNLSYSLRKVALATARFAGTHSCATSGTLWPPFGHRRDQEQRL